MLLFLLQTAMAEEAPPVVNGERTSDWPQVGVLVAWDPDRGGSNYCSGTLIHPEWVLTAAHCVDAGKDYDRAGYPTWFFAGELDDPDFYVEADKLKMHPDYSTRDLSYDVGLIHLTRPVDEIEPMRVNTLDMDKSWEDEVVTFVGYGATGDSGRGSGVKRMAEIPIYNVTSLVFYAYDRDKNLCSGDSGGGGLMMIDEAWHVVGVNSFVYAVQSNTSCDGGGSGSSRVDSAMDWIEGHVDFETAFPEEEGVFVLDSPTMDTGDPVAPQTAGVKPAGGCSSSPASPAMALGALALLGLALRRRRLS